MNSNCNDNQVHLLQSELAACKQEMLFATAVLDSVSERITKRESYEQSDRNDQLVKTNMQLKSQASSILALEQELRQQSSLSSECDQLRSELEHLQAIIVSQKSVTDDLETEKHKLVGGK